MPDEKPQHFIIKMVGDFKQMKNDVPIYYNLDDLKELVKKDPTRLTIFLGRYLCYTIPISMREEIYNDQPN